MLPWPGYRSNGRGGPLRVTEHPNGNFTTIDGVGWSTDLADLARMQVAAGWARLGTRLEITKLDAAGKVIGRREATIRDVLSPPKPAPEPDQDAENGETVAAGLGERNGDYRGQLQCALVFGWRTFGSPICRLGKLMA